MIGRTLAPDDTTARDNFGFRGRHTSLDFLTWDDCRTLARSGMTIGSHCRNHVRLARLGAGDERVASAGLQCRPDRG